MEVILLYCVFAYLFILAFSGIKKNSSENTAILKASKMPDSLVNLQMEVYRELFKTVYGVMPNA